MLKQNKTIVALSLMSLFLACGCTTADPIESMDNEQTEKQWLSNNYTGFDYSRGQLNVSGDGTAVTAYLPCETLVSCEIKPLFTNGSFDLLCGYTSAPIYYEMTSLSAPSVLSGIIFRISQTNITLLYVENYKETELGNVSFTFGEKRDVVFGKNSESVILKIDGDIVFEEKTALDVGNYYGFGVHSGTILRVYDIVEGSP